MPEEVSDTNCLVPDTGHFVCIPDNICIYDDAITVILILLYIKIHV